MNDKIRPEIRALIERGNVTLTEYLALRCNSWEFEAIWPALTNEALAHVVRHTVDNCWHEKRRPAVTYPDALAEVLVPELLRRLGQGVTG